MLLFQFIRYGYNAILMEWSGSKKLWKCHIDVVTYQMDEINVKKTNKNWHGCKEEKKLDFSTLHLLETIRDTKNVIEWNWLEEFQKS